MAHGRVLVTASSFEGEKGTLLVDLDSGAFEVLFPYLGGICAADGRLYVARLENDRTRIEAYDEDGLAWMRRVRHCFDTHSITATHDGLAVCSTGTNEVISLDRDGVETARWSPDNGAEGDSWHVNSLVSRARRLYTTCFGRFDTYRGWAGRIKESGLLIEVGTGRVVLDGLSAPHDPRPIDGGWFLNDAAKSATLFCPDDSGPRRVVFESPGFARGLEVFDDFLVVGSSSHRLNRRPTSGSFLFVIDRETGRLRNVIALPYHEIGHVVSSPSEAILSAIRREQSTGLASLSPRLGTVVESDRAGSIETVGPIRRSEDHPEGWTIPVRVSNRGTRVWSSFDNPPIHLACRAFDRHSSACFLEGNRTGLPIPIPPGRSLTFDALIEFPDADRQPDLDSIEITLIQETIAWWSASDLWTPAFVQQAASILEPAPG